ncbi:MAG: LysR family transcriptional regulator [Panacagrimonas sp.]|jgi:DNA-binding transcriptional LysR family regulator|nr:LysR family transcriptional regulator [Panacagrimonas sp.]MCC2655840.1 LysR family transcriptional regulator [Panacagrimonas sp.]
MSSLPDIPVFVRVVELGSFTAAADALEISKAAVSKYVGRLEDALGARLLQRTTRRLTLTEAGEAFYRRSAAALEEIDDATREVASLSGAPRGVLRISAPVYLGTTRIAPLIAPFRAAHPEVSLDIEFSDRHVDLVRERFDVAIRISQLGDSSLVARKLAPCPQLVCASPAYLKRRGTPKTPAELRDHDCLIYGLDRAPHEWKLRPPKGRWIAVNVRGPLRTNNDHALKQAAIDGLGLRQFPLFFIEAELADGRLVEVLPRCESPQLAIWAVYPARRHLQPKVRAIVDFLAERLAHVRETGRTA